MFLNEYIPHLKFLMLKTVHLLKFIIRTCTQVRFNRPVPYILSRQEHRLLYMNSASYLKKKKKKGSRYLRANKYSYEHKRKLYIYIYKILNSLICGICIRLYTYIIRLQTISFQWFWLDIGKKKYFTDWGGGSFAILFLGSLPPLVK